MFRFRVLFAALLTLAASGVAFGEESDFARTARIRQAEMRARSEAFDARMYAQIDAWGAEARQRTAEHFQARQMGRAIEDGIVNAQMREPIYRYVDGPGVRSGQAVVVPSGGTIYQYVDGPAVAEPVYGGPMVRPAWATREVYPARPAARSLVIPGGWSVSEPRAYGSWMTAEDVLGR